MYLSNNYAGRFMILYFIDVKRFSHYRPLR